MAAKKDIQIHHILLSSNEVEEMYVGNDGDKIMNGAIIITLGERKLLWSALDVSVSLIVVKRLINEPLIGYRSVRSDLDTM